ncbi:MAG: hypothetical protein ATN35_01250 [Epulopiscium sp. Nele67-Bin004]|nr:MAG: hypothetical protein ATN35_01250 [Epulopiscium sp. Nele67-Bin004]
MNTYDKLIQSAVVLFNENSYEKTSMNDIAKHAGISKGILYHYFTSKDELYLHCAKLCIDAFGEYILQNSDYATLTDFVDNIIRWDFFVQYPQHKGMYINILTRQPTHLVDELYEIQQQFKQRNFEFIKNLAMQDNISLGKNVTQQDVEAFIVLMHSITPNEISHFRGSLDISEITAYKQQFSRLLKIFINGLQADLD